MAYDVRAIRLIKATEKTPVLKEKVADYISLGHFDLMHVDCLSDAKTTNPLTVIQNDRISDNESKFHCNENYVYTVYLLRELTETDRDAWDKFWKNDKKTVFTAVTRIHGKYSGNEAETHLTNVLVNYCTSAREDSREDCRVKYVSTENGIITLSAPINEDGKSTEPVYCLFYDSMELSDSVMIMKSQSIRAIMEVTHDIFHQTLVRDTYTYTGIDRTILQDDTKSIEEIACENADVSYFTTRFSIRNLREAESYFKKLEDNTSKNYVSAQVTGTADRIYNWSNTSEASLLKIARVLTKLSPQSHKCFNDIITRIGISFEKKNKTDTIAESTDRINPAGDDTIRRTIHHWIKMLRKVLKNDNNKRLPSWIYSILKLLGTLKSMESNYVMDELAELIIPGALAMMERLNAMTDGFKNLQKISDYKEEELLDFIKGWNNLTQDVSNLESQLTQHPELIPVLYYIPATILQYERCFMMLCGDMLQDAAPEREFVPMLIPSGGSSLYTTAPLDPSQDDIPDDYKGKTPLSVYIPIQDLYDPLNCSFRMVHEISHYVGDAARHREERLVALCGCMAWILNQIWFEAFYTGSSFPDQQKEDAAINILQSELFESVQIEMNGDVPYLNRAMGELDITVSNFLEDPSYREKHFYRVDQTTFFRGNYSHTDPFSYIQVTQIAVARYYCSDHIKALVSTCSECYADISMILLLKISFREYYNCIFRDAYEKLKEASGGALDPPFREAVYKHLQRMTIVMEVIRSCECQTLKTSWNTEFVGIRKAANNGETWPWYAVQLMDYIDDYKNRVPNDWIVDSNYELLKRTTPCVLPVRELEILIDYLRKCATTLFYTIRSNEYIIRKGESHSRKLPTEYLKCFHINSDNINDNFSWNEMQNNLFEMKKVLSDKAKSEYVTNITLTPGIPYTFDNYGDITLQSISYTDIIEPRHKGDQSNCCKASEGHIYLAAEFQIKNNSDSSEGFDCDNLLKGTILLNGHEIEGLCVLSNAEETAIGQFDDFQPAETRTAYLLFEVADTYASQRGTLTVTVFDEELPNVHTAFPS